MKLYDKNSLYLRKVACLGKNGEIVEAICCADNYPRPWLILLPTKYKIECGRLDCQRTCYSAILDFREKNFSMIQAGINSTISKYDEQYSDNDDDDDDDDDDNDVVRENNKFEIWTLKPEPTLTLPSLTNTRKKNPTSKQLNKPVLSNKNTTTIAIPEIVLELIDLCNYVNNSELLQFEKIHSLCKMKNINLDEFLNHANYITKKSQNLDPKNVSQFHPTISKEVDKFVIESKINGSGSSGHVHGSGKERKPTCVPKQFDKTENLCNDHNNISEEGDCDCTTTYNCIPTTEKRHFNAVPNLTNCAIKTSLRTTDVTDCTINYCNHVESTIVINNNFSCCTNLSNSNCNSKESMKKLLRILLERPRPIFSNKTNTVSHSIGKKMIESQISDPKTVKLESSTSINYIPSYTVLKPAEKPLEEINLLESYQEGDSVKNYATYVDNKCAEMYRVYKKAQWDYETNITPPRKQKAIIAALEFKQLLRTVNKELTVLTKKHISDTKLQRQIRLLSLPGMNSLSELKSNEFEHILYAMEAIYSSAVVSKWKQHSEKVSLNPVIKNVMAFSVNPEELKYYWVEWRKATGKRIKPFFEQYVSFMDLAAKINGFNDASEMWTRYYESEDFVDTLSVHWEEVKPLYVELHAYVRHKLHGLYGDLAGANDKGKIPAHLTGDIWSQNWKTLFNRVMSINNEDDYMKIELKNKITPVKMAKTVEHIFLSMGYTELPENFWKNSIFTKNNNTAMSCEPSAWDMGNGTDFRIKLCATPNMGDLFEINHLVTLAEYYKEYKKLPYAFRNGATPGFTEAIAEAMVLSAHTKSSLKLFGLNNQYENEINKLMRTALEKVAFIPYSYILILWRSRVFNGQINGSNYNSEWWKLRSLYQGISPPVERGEDDFDIGSKQHIAVNQPYIKYFLSTILQFQVYEALCKKSKFQGNLHNCDLTGSLAAGKILRNIMSMGSSYHWKVAMQKLTGTRKIDSKPLMRYFDPLLKWLKEKNRDENVKVGWED